MLDKSNFYMSLGKNIEIARKEKGYSMDKFIEVANLGMSKSTLSAIENGKQQISAFQLYLVTEALDLKLSELLRGLEAMGHHDYANLLNKNDLNKLESL
ncbi:MAG: helix-turn-helix transcriptional regulator [Patescibacteria group bacterium]|nr:helix-turn-helix transcriptional regulator [Patescibacteria group bacterium]